LRWPSDQVSVSAPERYDVTDLLPSARGKISMDRHLKSNTVKTRTHSLFHQGCMLYDLITNMPERRRRPLAERYADILEQLRVVTETFAIV
jgi:hypothetical protein